MWHIFGFEQNKRFFEKLIEENLLGHAYIFHGQEMIGKKTFALELAAMASGNNSEINPNLLFIDSAASESGQSIAIEEIRKIKSFVFLTSYLNSRKFVIIDDAHLMTVEAQNALLKILEEPSPSSVLILVTPSPDLLLPTIVSRCQEINFPVHSRAAILKFIKDPTLSKTADLLPAQDQEFLSEFVNGRIGLAKNIIEEKSFGEIKNSIEELVELTKLDLNERLIAAQKISEDKDKTKLPRRALYWMLYMRMRMGEAKAQRILSRLLGFNQIINQPQFNQRLALENFLIQL